MAADVYVMVRYYVTEEYRRETLLATGQVPDKEEKVQIRLADLPPELRQAVVDRRGVGATTYVLDVTDDARGWDHDYPCLNHAPFEDPVEAVRVALDVLKARDAYLRQMEALAAERSRQEEDRRRKAREEAERAREAEQAAQAERLRVMREWAEAHGSDRLRGGLALGYRMWGVYRSERAAALAKRLPKEWALVWEGDGFRVVGDAINVTSEELEAQRSLQAALAAEGLGDLPVHLAQVEEVEAEETAIALVVENFPAPTGQDQSRLIAYFPDARHWSEAED